MKFGRLTVLARDKDHIRPSGQKQVTWLCECECGKLTVVEGAELRNGSTTSCGCFQREYVSNSRKKHNKYDLSGEFGIGYTSHGDEFYFDLDDYEKIKDYCWRKRKDGMFDAKTRNNGNQRILLHRLILNTDLQVDHIEHNRYDNRKSKLRVVDNSKNQMNKNIAKNNKSGVKGVIWHKRDLIWEAYISVNNNHIYLGRYKNLQDAIKARADAEEKYFGEYNYKNVR